MLRCSRRTRNTAVTAELGIHSLKTGRDLRKLIRQYDQSSVLSRARGQWNNNYDMQNISTPLPPSPSRQCAKPCKAVPQTLVYCTPSTCAPGNRSLIFFKRPLVWSSAVQSLLALFTVGGLLFGVPRVVRLSVISRSASEHSSASHARDTHPEKRNNGMWVVFWNMDQPFFLCCFFCGDRFVFREADYIKAVDRDVRARCEQQTQEISSCVHRVCERVSGFCLTLPWPIVFSTSLFFPQNRSSCPQVCCAYLILRHHTDRSVRCPISTVSIQISFAWLRKRMSSARA